MARKRKPSTPRTSGLPQYPRPTPSQAVKAPSGRPHGERKRLEDAQRAVPLPKAPAGVDPRQAAVEAARGFNPEVTPLGAPTQDPNEPLTAGMAIGRGPGPEVLDVVPVGDDVGVVVRAMYRDFPNEDLLRLINELELEGR